MSEQESQATGVNEQAQNQTAAKVYEESEVNSRVAAARRDAEAKLKETLKRLEALEAEKQEREEAELSELDKLKKQLSEKDNAINELTGFKDKWNTYELELADKVDKELSGLTDEQKELVEAVPLSKRLNLISQFKASTKQQPPQGYSPGTINGYTVESLMELQKKDPKKFAEVYPQWKAAKGN